MVRRKEQRRATRAETRRREAEEAKAEAAAADSGVGHPLIVMTAVMKLVVVLVRRVFLLLQNW